jgi:hypothetical protein
MRSGVVAWLLALACGLACGSSDTAAPPPPAPAQKPPELPVRAPAPPPPRKLGTERRLYPREVSASSFLEADTRPYVQYHPRYTVDDDPTTAWNEGATGDGSGQWVSFDVTPQTGVSHIRLRVLNGFQYDDAIWRANPRAKTVEVRANSTPVHRQVLADDKAWQDIAFDTELPQLDDLLLAVVDTYPGTRFHDLAISEVEIYVTSQGAEQPDVEKQNHDAVIAWKQHQREAAKLAKLGSGELVVGDDEAKPDEAAAPFVDRAERPVADSPVVVASHGTRIDPTALDACFDGDGFDAGCVAPMYTTTGMTMTDTAKPAKGAFKRIADCRLPMMAWDDHGTIREVATRVCHDQTSRGSFDYSEDYNVVFEYDDDARLRVVWSDDTRLWLAWGTRDGKPAVVGGAWWRRGRGNGPHALRPRT